MALEPTNYYGMMSPTPSLTEGLDAYQQAQQQSAQRALVGNQIQQQLRAQQLQSAALQDALKNPSPQAYRNYLLVNPQAHEAIKTAYDGLDAETQRQQLQDLTAVQGYLGAGQPDKAQAIIQKRSAAAKAAGQQTTAYDTIGDLINTDPDHAKALVGLTLAGTVGADKMAQTMASLGKESREQSEFPTEVALKKAQTAQALALAAKDNFITANPDQTVLAVNPSPGGNGAPATTQAATPEGTRAARNNNPLNLTTLPQGKWSGQTGTDGKFAVFSSPQAGMAAADKNLVSYADNHGINTVQGVVNRWAPQGDGSNDPAAYAATVAADLGVAPDAKLDLGNPQVRKALLGSMAKVEAGGGSSAPSAPSGQAPGQLTPVFQGAMADVKDALLSDDAVALVGQQYLSKGPEALQNLGQGKVGVQNKNRIMDWVARTAKEAGTSNPELVARFAQNKGNQAALVQNTKSLSAINDSLHTLDANLDFALGLAKRGLGPTGVPLLDMPINKIRMSLGSADVKTLDNVLTTTGDEWARILTTSTGTGGGSTSDAAQAQAHKMLNSGMTLKQLIDVANAAKTEGANRQQSYVNENHRLTAEISGQTYTPPPPPGGGAPAGGGQGPMKVSSIQEAMALKPGTVFLTPDGRQKVR